MANHTSASLTKSSHPEMERRPSRKGLFSIPRNGQRDRRRESDYIAPTRVNMKRFREGIRHLKDERECGEVVKRLMKELSS